MSDLPPGEFSEILVGQHWPSSPAMTTIRNASANRGSVEDSFTSFSEQLRQIQAGPLANQNGLTADRIRDAFESGGDHAQSIADANRVKKAAYNTAHNVADELRDALTTIAEDGNSKIRSIQNSKGTLADKIAKITEVVVNAQTQANAKAAISAGDILDAMQEVFTKQGLDASARRFAKDHGVDPASMFGPPNKEDIQAQIKNVLNRLDPPQSPANDVPAHFSGDLQTDASQPQIPVASNGESTTVVGSLQSTPAPQSTMNPVNADTGTMFGELRAGPPPPLPVSQTPPTPPATTGPTTPVTGTIPRAVIPQTPSPTVPVTPGTPAVTPTAPLTAPAANPPASLLSSFEHGLHSGPVTPVPPMLSPVEPHLAPGPADVPPPTMPAGTHSTVFEAPVPSTTPAPAPDTATPYLAAPLSPGPPPSVTTAPATTFGPLPGYGSDLRPVTVSAATAPAAPPAAGPATSASVPATSTGGGTLGQPAVVRRSPAPPSAAAPAEQAVLANSGGAIAGAVSVEATARTRLQQLVDFVARQEPRLRWAAGDRVDGTTLLVTDLAGGWIPPHIEIPAGLQLLEPQHRTSGIATLLGAMTVTASFSPGQHLPGVDHVEEVPTSSRARHGSVIAELGWELRLATTWRDGLPRLAHTLVKAACAGTGVLDSETALLREHLAATRERVVHDYPDSIDAAAVANWQLLAAIDAFIANERSVATYHFSWFQASSLLRAGGSG